MMHMISQNNQKALKNREEVIQCLQSTMQML